jgi:hypothetical protein
MEAIVLCLVKTVVGWVVLMLVGTNLLGLVVRGLVPAHEARKMEVLTSDPFVQELITRHKRANVGVTVFFAALGLVYLYALLRFWNIGVVGAAVMLMLGRLPDLLWEIRTGQKVKPYSAPKGLRGLLAMLLSWGALPVLWFALCRG